MEAPLVRVAGVSHRFFADDRSKRERPVVMRDVELTASAGEFISIVGPSGCGKSTLLALLAGLAMPAEGVIEIDGQRVTRPRRDVGFVFQRDALLPWRSLRENVALPLRYRRVPRKQAHEQAQAWLERFGIGDLADRFPYQVSGGQRKRASIATTMVYEPSIMLMDEPFGSLDVQTRDYIETDILSIWGELKTQTVLFVTHDLEEAVAMSDRVIVMSRGPGTVIGDYKIDLPRPRDVRDVRGDDRFVEYCKLIWELLRVEVSATQRRTFTRPSAAPGDGVAAG